MNEQIGWVEQMEWVEQIEQIELNTYLLQYIVTHTVEMMGWIAVHTTNCKQIKITKIDDKVKDWIAA